MNKKSTLWLSSKVNLWILQNPPPESNAKLNRTRRKHKTKPKERIRSWTHWRSKPLKPKSTKVDQQNTQTQHHYHIISKTHVQNSEKHVPKPREVSSHSLQTENIKPQDLIFSKRKEKKKTQMRDSGKMGASKEREHWKMDRDPSHH